MADTALAPLYDPKTDPYDNPSFMNTPSDIATARSIGAQTTPKVSPIIPKDIQPDTIEARLKAEGSGTSTLSLITAWLGAAKGDYRGLQAIEESKRRTALAKSMIPEMTRVNKLVQSGKWEEASDYVNEMASSYGTRADYLVPYFTQMQADIKKKQEGWKNLEGLYNLVKDAVTEDNVNYPVVQALGKAVKAKDQLSETTLQGFMTRFGSPHIQNIEGTIYATSPLTGKTSRDIQPQVYKDKDFDTVTGIQTAAKAGLTTQMMADLFNGRVVTREDNTKIEPDSREAAIIKSYFISQQPKEARLKIMQNIKLEPTLYAQLIDEGISPENVALGEYGKGGIGKAITGQLDRQTRAQIAVNEGTMASDPRAVAATGKTPFDLDSFSEIKEPITVNDIKNSKGRIILLRPEVINTQIKPALAEIESLALIPSLFEGGGTPETIGERGAKGLQQWLSSYLGFPLGKEVEPRQLAKTILKRAIETVENTPEISAQITGRDSKDLKDLKAYAAGDFKTASEFIKAAETVTQRLQQVLRRAVGSMETEGVTVTPTGQKGARSPASVLAPVISKAKRPQQSQITRDPYGPGGIQMPPEMEEKLKQKVLATGKAAKESGKPTGGAVRIEVPKGTPNQPTLGQPTQPAYNEEDEVRKAMQNKRLQRVR